MSVKSKVQDVRSAGPKNPAFEVLHPRDRSGRDAGEFIDVLGGMAALGGHWDAERGVWMMPADRRAELDVFAQDIGFDLVDVPDGMRPIREEDRAARWGPGTKIPPAWTDVLVSDDPNSSVQVVGRDVQGRRQAIYSVEHTEGKAAQKFARIDALDRKMGDIDKRLSETALTSDSAAALMLIRKMGLRPGSKKDTKARHASYGATTLERRHVQVSGDTVRLRFVPGKHKGREVDLSLEDAELAKVMKARIRGRRGDDRLFDTNEDRLNDLMKEVGGADFKVKDLRTHMGTAEAKAFILEHPELSGRELELAAGAHVASILGNTRKVALDSYIDPSVFTPREPAGAPGGFAVGMRVHSDGVGIFAAGQGEIRGPGTIVAMTSWEHVSTGETIQGAIVNFDRFGEAKVSLSRLGVLDEPQLPPVTLPSGFSPGDRHVLTNGDVVEVALVDKLAADYAAARNGIWAKNVKTGGKDVVPLASISGPAPAPAPTPAPRPTREDLRDNLLEHFGEEHALSIESELAQRGVRLGDTVQLDDGPGYIVGFRGGRVEVMPGSGPPNMDEVRTVEDEKLGLRVSAVTQLGTHQEAVAAGRARMESFTSPKVKAAQDEIARIEDEMARLDEELGPQITWDEIKRMSPSEVRRYDEIDKPRMALRGRRTTLQREIRSARRKGILGELKRRRQTGSPVRTAIRREPDRLDLKADRAVREMSALLPDAWTENMPTISIQGSTGRAHWIGGRTNRIRANTRADAMHELGHAIEENNPEIGALVKAFFKHRTAGHRLEVIEDHLPDERGFVDAFPNRYTGRYYFHGGTEVLSMGLEGLFHDNNALLEDEEYTAFIVGLLFDVKKTDADVELDTKADLPVPKKVLPGALPDGVKVRVTDNGVVHDAVIVRVSSDGTKTKVRLSGGRQPWVPSENVEHPKLDPSAPTPEPVEPMPPLRVAATEPTQPVVPVPGRDGRTNLRSAYEGGFTAGDDLAGGRTNEEVRRVTLSDGSLAVLKKPASGEHRRELTSSVVANALGFDTHAIDIGDGRLVQSFVDGTPGGIWATADAPAEAEWKNRIDVIAPTLPGGREIGVMDWLIRNRNRHDGNWMVTPDGSVVPIDHGLTWFDSSGADRDVPRSPFARHWLGLTQKPTPRPARGRSHDDAANVKGPKVKLAPLVSQSYLEEVRVRLEAARQEFNDKEWTGMMARLELLIAAAPATIPGELPMPEAM